MNIIFVILRAIFVLLCHLAPRGGSATLLYYRVKANRNMRKQEANMTSVGSLIIYKVTEGKLMDGLCLGA